MATFIAIVQSDGDGGYTASFPDFPGCAAAAPTLDRVIAQAREALLLHIERLLEANQRIAHPTAAGAIERGDALLLAEPPIAGPPRRMRPAKDGSRHRMARRCSISPTRWN